MTKRKEAAQSSDAEVDPARVVFHPVDAGRWGDMEALFESPGAPKYCWCMAWRAAPKEVKTDNRSRKAAMYQRVSDHVPVGLLGYLDGEPVAWCSIAPRPTYRDLGGPEAPAGRPDSVWSIVCFFIVRRLRRRGLTRRLIEAAANYARRQGGQVLEAYPVDPDSPSYRFMGFVSCFEDAGFQEIGRAGLRRHVMRRSLV